VTPGLVGRLGSARVHRDIRGWDKASDHVPVMIDLD
jgi:exodeoxyribonuclease-3